MFEKVIIMGARAAISTISMSISRIIPATGSVAFTAAQIPDIDCRIYPPELAGEDYPTGIPIYPEDLLVDLIRKHRVDLVAFSYSDVPHIAVMHKASMVMAEGADFILIGATYTMLRSGKPVVAVCAVRTGCGKSPTTRRVCEIIRKMGKRVVAVRHPMPYGDLRAQAVQRFASFEDFEKHQCTIEEREEYDPWWNRGL
jgi:predicted GTPase